MKTKFVKGLQNEYLAEHKWIGDHNMYRKFTIYALSFFGPWVKRWENFFFEPPTNVWVATVFWMVEWSIFYCAVPRVDAVMIYAVITPQLDEMAQTAKLEE